MTKATAKNNTTAVPAAPASTGAVKKRKLAPPRVPEIARPLKPARKAGSITDMKYLMQDINANSIKRTFQRCKLASLQTKALDRFRRSFARFLTALTMRLVIKVQHDKRKRITDRDVDWVIESFGRRFYGVPDTFKSEVRQKVGGVIGGGGDKKQATA